MTLVERDARAGVQPEFPTHPEADLSATRRTFLKAAGFSFTGLLAGACRPALQHAIPHVVLPELTPGQGFSYASTCGACEAGCGLLVTTHDGRPTKIEGNPDHPLSGGATCAVGQASILGLYDSQRLAHPLKAGARATWADVDAEIASRLAAAQQNAGAVRLLTGTVAGPTTAALIKEFVAAFPGSRHVSYDPISTSAILDAYALTHGVRLLPRYRFDRADVVVGLDADFLGTWISPVEFTRGYSARRRVTEEAAGSAYHVQIESRLSLTGSKADQRLRVAPSELGPIATHLATRLAQRSGTPLSWAPAESAVSAATLDSLADRLWAAQGRALVVSGSQDVRLQVVCSQINQLLGSFGTTIDLERPSNQRQGNDADLETLRGEISRGEVAVLIIAGVNPVYDLPGGETLAGELKKVPFLVSVADRLDETASLAHVVCPDHHYLESWGDSEPVAGVVSLTQPTIHPFHDTRAFIESIATWTGKPGAAYDLVRQHWEQAIYPRAGSADPFPTFWNRTLERGVIEVAPAPREPLIFNAAAAQPVERDAGVGDSLALVLYPKVGMFDGRHAHNPWLHELPDPLTKVTWDNYACLSPAAARRLDVSDGDILRLTADGTTLEVPAFIQPGQHDAIVALALGYGRAGTDRFNKTGPAWLLARPSEGPVGRNAAPLVAIAGGIRRYDGRRVDVRKTGGRRRLASTQVHHSLTTPGALPLYGKEPLAIVQETTFAELRAPEEAREGHGELWPPDHTYEGHRWGISVDMNSCTGCSACVVACQSENNIPVVGYDEVIRQREMHWLRIDRYYSGGDGDITVAHQPMMCQQCEHAPCETVCPVLATVHSSEGLNQQVYNRCVGTRYCANNCPYKVRRFNWFNYPHDDVMQNLTLNPNVTVRSRGVMEKCTFCVQRIEEAKIEARRAGTTVQDGAIKTACQQTCPADAIVFGDLNDPNSRVSRLSGDRRAYRVLEELNTRPSVRYLRIVRHEDMRQEGGSQGRA
jgi:molybdopterin-containing oxidoreductase family iron-sulfur binding subunit